MEALLTHLDQIKTLLEQVYAITQNQTTVLLEQDEESGVVDVLEQMFVYKSEVMNELERVEGGFQEQYAKHRESLEGTALLTELQSEVGKVLKLKEEIVAIEQRNLMLMEKRQRGLVGRVEVPLNPQKVAEAYKKHSRV